MKENYRNSFHHEGWISEVRRDYWALRCVEWAV